jgi:hypothetical protein
MAGVIGIVLGGLIGLALFVLAAKAGTAMRKR